MRAWREQFEQRPLLIFCAALIVGLIAVATPWRALFLAPCVAVTSRGRTLAVLAVGFALGWSLGPSPSNPVYFQKRYVEAVVDVVTAARPSKAGERMIVVWEGRRFQLTCLTPTDLDLGDRAKVRGVLKPVSESALGFAAQEGIVGAIDASRIDIETRGAAWVRLGAACRRSFVAFANQHLDARAASVVSAMTFNHDADLDPSLRQDLRTTGTIHIISTSGLHVAMVAVGAMALFALLPLPRSFQVVLLILLLALYVAAAGLRAPGVRSAMMAAFLASAYLFRRQPDGLSALAGSGAAYLIWQPTTVYDVGAQLSFVIFAGLILFAPSWSFVPEEGSIRRRLRTAAHGGAVAFLASAPLVAYHFGSVALLSVVMNLAILPFAPAIVGASLVGWLSGFLWPALGGWLLRAEASPLVTVFGWVERIGGAWPDAAPATPPFSGYWLPVVYGLALLLWRPSGRR